MAYEYFYEGTPSSLEPYKDAIYTGANVPAGVLGAPTSVQTANQITEVSNLLNTGMKTIELSTISPEVFEMIPKQHLKEINRLSGITNADITLHAPLIEPSGFTQQGWNEQNRELAERQLKDTVLRAYEVSPEKPIPVTIHASAIPGTETMPAESVKGLEEEQKKAYGNYVPTQMIAVNQETGELIPLRREEEYYPEEGKVIRTPEEKLEMLNHTHWINKITNLAFYKKEADEILIPAYAQIAPKIMEGKISEEEQKELAPALNKYKKADLFLDNIISTFRTFYDEAYKAGDEKTREIFDHVAKIWQEKEKEMRKNPLKAPALKSEMIDEIFGALDAFKKPELREHAPQFYKPVEQFAIEKASETFSNVALEAYKKFGSKAPIISIENPPYGSALSTGEELKKLIEETRQKFIEKAIKEGKSKSEAQKAAEQMIGATWDTSHISMMRRMGYKPEQLVEEAKKIAPFVKHVHLNDNFGYTHTDLPPGMGSVPIKEILAELEKKGYKGKHIFEGAQFFQHFKVSPHAMVLEAMGSPIYPALAQPTWAQVYGTLGAYASGYGPFLPEQHFSIYGAGFAGLPTELGGQVPGKQSRLSGTPMT